MHAPRPEVLQHPEAAHTRALPGTAALLSTHCGACRGSRQETGMRAPSSRSVFRLRSCASSSTSALYCRSRKSACAAARPDASGPRVRVKGRERGEGRARRAAPTTGSLAAAPLPAPRWGCCPALPRAQPGTSSPLDRPQPVRAPLLGRRLAAGQARLPRCRLPALCSTVMA